VGPDQTVVLRQSDKHSRARARREARKPNRRVSNEPRAVHQALDQLPDADRAVVKSVIDTYITRHRIQQLTGTGTPAA
jgi:hypothetical protein